MVFKDPRKASKRAVREKAVGDAFTAGLTSGSTRAASKPDAELFFVDNAATTTDRKAKRRVKAAKVVGHSKVETLLVGRLADKVVSKRTRDASMQMEKKPPGRKAKAALQRAADAKHVGWQVAVQNAHEPAIGDDLWADDEEDAGPYAKKVKGGASRTQFTRPKALGSLGGVAVPGQSYNPTLEAQQLLVQEGTDILHSKKRQAKEDRKWWEHRAAVSAANQAALEAGGEAAIDEASDDDAEAEVDEAAGRGPLRQKEKFTKAKRNKMKRAREAEVDLRGRKAVKVLRVDLDHARKIRKELEAETAANEQMRLETEEAKKATLAAGPVRTEPRAVGLSDELSGELRSTRAVQNPGSVLLELQQGCKMLHAAVKKVRELKKKRLKYRGAKYIQRYRTPFEAPA
ncbi:hypothetical protein M885DRAFT_523929 [Pelagophyceae sp. CCMP2097]|nr:hypothetical protein M885DRAFT_523929 [Pelagophyceae sp. CCMP2097]